MMGNQIDEWWESHKTGDERVDRVFVKFLGVDGIHLPEQPYDGHTDSMKLTPDEIEEAMESYGQDGEQGKRHTAHDSESCDSRNKLEAEVRSHYAYTVSTLMYPDSLNKKTDMLEHLPVDTVIGWLDRQALITAKEFSGDFARLYNNVPGDLSGVTVFGMTLDEIARLKLRIHDLDFENTRLKSRVEELEDENLYAGGSADDWYHIAKDLMETSDEIARTLDRIAGLMGANDG